MNPPYAVRTWHYLRLALVALVLGLVAAVLYEHAQVHCFQTSISAYWYTPARGYFVAMLLGMSVCLVCLRGSTEAEDILLNFAGMFAPVVAFAPTPPESKDSLASRWQARCRNARPTSPITGQRCSRSAGQ